MRYSGLAALAALMIAPGLGLGGCASSRFGDGPISRASARPSPYNAPLEPVSPAAPSSAVSSAPLAPPPGAALAPEAPPVPPPVAAAEPPELRPQIQQQASIAPPPVAAPTGRSSVVGGWTAKEASGATCRVQLASTPALDLYKANATGCANRDLARVTAWDYRDGEVYLYQPGGTVAARLRGGGGGLDGVIAKSGAPLTLAR